MVFSILCNKSGILGISGVLLVSRLWSAYIERIAVIIMSYRERGRQRKVHILCSVLYFCWLWAMLCIWYEYTISYVINTFITLYTYYSITKVVVTIL